MRVLDLFCGAGGAAVGLHRAFPEAEITGVDIKPQKNYPFNFVQADALEFPLEEYDFIWASPPCQAYSYASARWRNDGKEYPDLLAIIAIRLRGIGIPYCIENVTGAHRMMVNPFVLCGLSFDLKVIRHRWFETNFYVLAPTHSECGSAIQDCRALTISGHGGESSSYKFEDWKEAMGIDWMTKQELTQAVPPAYSEFIGRQLRNILERAALK